MCLKLRVDAPCNRNNGPQLKYSYVGESCVVEFGLAVNRGFPGFLLPVPANMEWSLGPGARGFGAVGESTDLYLST